MLVLFWITLFTHVNENMFWCALQQEPVELWIQRPPSSPNTASEVHSVCRQGAHLLLHHYTALTQPFLCVRSARKQERLPVNINSIVFLWFSWLTLNTAKRSHSSRINSWELDVSLLSVWGLHVCLTPVSTSDGVCDFQELFWIENPADGFWTRFGLSSQRFKGQPSLNKSSVFLLGNRLFLFLTECDACFQNQVSRPHRQCCESV